MILQSILLVLEVLSSFLLIAVILLQKSKGGGLAGSAFGGGGGGDSVFGARAGNVLTKITIGLSIFFLSNTLFLAFLFAGEEDASLMEQQAGAPVEVRDVSPPPDAGSGAPAALPPADAISLPETAPGDASTSRVLLDLPEEASEADTETPVEE